jgi:translation initiation factor eIF-2B subunit gamma
MPLATTEFQAVILATVSDGDTLSPLTDSLPLALLPVANRPLLSYQLELLARSHSFTTVLVVTVEQWLPQLSTWVSEHYKGALQVELVVVPDGAGSADSLRHIRAKLTTDFVVLAGDVITDVPFQRMADQHRLQGAAVTALFRESAPRDPGVAKKAKDLDGIDFVGVDEGDGRLLSVEAAADCDHGILSLSRSLLRQYPHVTLRTDLVDAHVYLFAHWVLDLLELKEHFSSAKFELLPYLVRKQFLPKDNLAQLRQGRGGKASSNSEASGADPTDDAASVWGNSASAFAMSAGKMARQVTEHADGFKCGCYLVPHDTSYCTRASTLREYAAANLDLSRESRVTLYEKNEGSEGTAAKEGNFVHKSRDKDSTLGEGVEVGGRTAIKKSCIGPHCRIGSGVKLTNCILMGHVVIGDKVNMTNSIVCENVEVREGASLKDVQVAAGVTVEANAVHKGEVLTAGGDDMDED